MRSCRTAATHRYSLDTCVLDVPESQSQSPFPTPPQGSPLLDVFKVTTNLHFEQEPTASKVARTAPFLPADENSKEARDVHTLQQPMLNKLLDAPKLAATTVIPDFLKIQHPLPLTTSTCLGEA